MAIIKKRIRHCLTLTVLLMSLAFAKTAAQAAERLQPVGDEIVIVIDPGHGGENLGTESGHSIEKEMTLVTAKTMKEELEKYDNVKVYLTRSTDEDMDLDKRAEFAAEVEADFLFSIHYNASEYHTMFGSEVWISCEAPYNAYGYQFGYEHLLSMGERGLFVRGVKSRVGDKGDYYGILRHCVEQSIPAVIIEHCYVDEERDAEYIRNAEGWAEFGRMDALSVAKYFGLKSAALGVDYSENANSLQPVPTGSQALVPGTILDKTDPDICAIELAECDYSTGELSLTVSAADYDSPLINYDCSIDGGQSWSRREIWPGCNTLTGEYTDTFQLNLKIPSGVQPDIIVRAYNLSDLDTESNLLHLDQAFVYGGTEGDGSGQGSAGEADAPQPATQESGLPDHSRKSIGTTTFMPASGDLSEDGQDTRIFAFLKLCLVIVIILFFVVLVSQTVSNRKRRRRRRERKF